MEEENKFAGYCPATLKFLKSLEKNNNKQWFEKHKNDYKNFVLEPTRSLVNELGDFMLDIDPRFEIAPSINKTISRMYRDTRFSKDKTPYRSNFWIVFKRQKKEWSTQGCAYFFEVYKDWYHFGMGFYDAAPAIMSKFREQIDENPEEFLKAISFYSKQKTFELKGENYKRIIDNSKPKEIQDWYQKKSMYLVCERKIDKALFSRKLVSDLKKGFDMLGPVYRYLQKTISLAMTT
ncbi:MAG: DUF2461 domain-containing protein [Sedimentisphaerales bacterium]|nr:DUF2461 domain-containing protein [Sedimentisphaerales bacterium]